MVRKAKAKANPLDLLPLADPKLFKRLPIGGFWRLHRALDINSPYRSDQKLMIEVQTFGNGWMRSRQGDLSRGPNNLLIWCNQLLLVPERQPSSQSPGNGVIQRPAS